MDIDIHGYTLVRMFFNNPQLVHERATRHIAKYKASRPKCMDLMDGNRWLSTRGVVYRTNKGKIIECYIDTNFTSGWD